jgi:hypothetical protein
MPGLWNQPGPAAWRRALDRYDDVVAAQGVPGLSELDAWYREALPAAIAGRDAA